MNRSTPGLPVCHQLLELPQTHVRWGSDAIQPSHPLLSPSPPALNLSNIGVFSNESALCIRWPKYWSFSFNISPSNEHPGLISFRMDWLNLLAVQGTLKSLLQYHSSKPSILLHSTFFIVQLSHPVNKKVKNAVLGCSLKNNRMISVCFQGKPFNITVIKVYAPTSNAEEAEVEWFYEDLLDLLEVTPKKDVLFIIRDWNAKVGSQEIPGVTSKFGFGV